MTSSEKALDIKVKDIMSSPAIVIRSSASVMTAARLMKGHEIGGVIVVDKNSNPIGLITERDIVRRVVSRNLVPSKVKVTEAMSSPLVTVDSNTNIVEAAKKMRQQKVRRLAVMDSGKLVGVVTSNDIVDVTPAILDVLAERSQIKSPEAIREVGSLAGYCGNCEEWSDNLKFHEGVYLCPDCLLEAKKGSEPVY